MNKQIKRVLSVMLCVLLLCGAAPIGLSAAAEDGDEDGLSYDTAFTLTFDENFAATFHGDLGYDGENEEYFKLQAPDHDMDVCFYLHKFSESNDWIAYNGLIMSRVGPFSGDVTASIIQVFDSEHQQVGVAYEGVSYTYTDYTRPKYDPIYGQFIGYEKGEHIDNRIAKITVSLQKNETYYVRVTRIIANIEQPDGTYVRGAIVSNPPVLNYDLDVYGISTFSIDSLPNKTIYAVGESLNQDGLQVSLHLPDGSIRILDPSEYTCTYSTETVGTQTVTVKTTDGIYSASFSINVVESYACGDNLDWSFDTDTGTLTITGTGPMRNFDGYSKTPWYSVYSEIKTVVIDSGVITIGEHAFDNCYNLTSVTIPDSVTSIGHDAFAWCGSLASVTIPDGVTSIGDYIFIGCENLTSVTIPDSVTSIGEDAFGKCGHLRSVTMGNNVVSIGDYAFCYCSSLTEIAMPNGLTSIGKAAFEGCGSLKSVAIPNSVTSIGDSAFGNCSGVTALTVDSGNAYFSSDANGVLYNKDKTELIQYPAGNPGTSFTIPDTVASIGRSAFSGCKNLTSITIPNSVTSIGSNAFNFCTSLASITIPNGVTSIEEDAFYYCSSLTGITIPNSVTSIGKSAFYGCTNLTDITIPDNVMAIGDSAFGSCINLTSITIPNGITRINKEMFYNCRSLTGITIPDGVTSIGEYAFYNCTNLTSVTIPNSVKNIGKSAFYDCTNLASVTIPNGMTSINEGTFDDCSSLTSVTIPNSVTSIGAYAFDDCTSLVSVTIPNSVKSIGKYAFYGVGNIVYSGSASGSPWGAKNVNKYVEGMFVFDSDQKTTLLWCSRGAADTVTIPVSVTTIGDSAFSGCKRLASITIPDSVTTIGKDAFYDVANIAYSGSASGSPWGAKCMNGFMDGILLFDSAEKKTLLYCSKNAEGEIVIPDSVTAIGDSAFEGCTNLTGVTIPDSVKTIGNRAFYECEKLASITLSNSVTTIGSSAFEECTSLTSITIPDSVTSIGSSAFDDCTSLTSVTIPDSVTSIGDYVFFGCKSLANVTIPDSVTSIGSSAFDDCTSLTSVTIPDSVTSIGDYVFFGCKSLANVTIPDSVTSIGAQAFSYCNSLTYVHIPSSVTKIADNTFFGSDKLEYICSDTADCYAKTYAEANVIEFRVCGGHGAACEHNYTSAVTTEATCTAAGVMTYTCTLCGSSYTEAIPALGHNYNAVVTAPTTTSGGYTTYTCTRCGDTYTDNYTDPLPATAYTVTTVSFTPAVDEEDIEEYTSRGYALEGGTVTGGGEYAEGTEVTLTATPNAYYKFIGWYDGDTLVSTDAAYSFTVTGDVTLTAKFIKNGDVNGDGYVDAGDATLILRHVVAGTPEQDPLMRQSWQLTVADVNQSYNPADPECPLEDEVDAGDATLILRFLVDPGKTLPC